jgi:hypothetical protein
MSDDIRMKLAKIRALSFSPNMGEAALARKKLSEMMAAHGITEDKLDEFVASMPQESRLPDSSGSVQDDPFMPDFGLYVDGRAARKMLFHCVMYAVGWKRWSEGAVAIYKRHRKYSFSGVRRSEALYIQEIYALHMEGFEVEAHRHGMTPEHGFRATSTQNKMLIDALFLAYVNRSELFPADLERKTASAAEVESDPYMRAASRMMHTTQGRQTPLPYNRRMAPAGSRTKSIESKPRQIESK